MAEVGELYFTVKTNSAELEKAKAQLTLKDK